MKSYLALFTGAPQPDGTPPMSPDDVQAGMQAWGGWMARHADVIEVSGGPVGQTKKISPSGTADIRNNVGGFVIVRAESHAAAAKMFEGQPHFTIFPGDGVEVMEILPIPGG